MTLEKQTLKNETRKMKLEKQNWKIGTRKGKLETELAKTKLYK